MKRFRAALQEVTAIRSKNPKAKLDVEQREASTVGMRLALFEGLTAGRSITLLPTGAAAWSPLKPGDAALTKLREGFVSNDQAAFDAGLAELRAKQAREEARFQADPSKIAIEVLPKNCIHSAGRGFSYLAAGLAMLVIPGKPGYAAGWVLGLSGFLLQLSGFIFRILISGRAPVTNMYESVVWVAFGTILFALLFDGDLPQPISSRRRVPVAVASLILADTQTVILDRSIHPLVPVLADNFWLTTHVLAHHPQLRRLCTRAWGQAHRPRQNPLRFKGLPRIAQLPLPDPPDWSAPPRHWHHPGWRVGELFLGAISRDWDPKETWALIALLTYLFLLHGRIAGRWGGFGMAVARGAGVSMRDHGLVWSELRPRRWTSQLWVRQWRTPRSGDLRSLRAHFRDPRRSSPKAVQKIGVTTCPLMSCIFPLTENAKPVFFTSLSETGEDANRP
jgi:hypothetical protein